MRTQEMEHVTPGYCDEIDEGAGELHQVLPSCCYYVKDRCWLAQSASSTESRYYLTLGSLARTRLLAKLSFSGSPPSLIPASRR